MYKIIPALILTILTFSSSVSYAENIFRFGGGGQTKGLFFNSEVSINSGDENGVLEITSEIKTVDYAHNQTIVLGQDRNSEESILLGFDGDRETMTEAFFASRHSYTDDEGRIDILVNLKRPYDGDVRVDFDFKVNEGYESHHYYDYRLELKVGCFTDSRTYFSLHNEFSQWYGYGEENWLNKVLELNSPSCSQIRIRLIDRNMANPAIRIREISLNDV